MDFAPSERVAGLLDRIREFTVEHIDPVEREAMEATDREVGPGVPYPSIVLELRERARAEGLWNLFLSDHQFGPGLTNWEYGMLCEQMGRSGIAPTVFNCAAPDTGNAEILAEHGSEEQQARWLQPLLDGEIRSCFSMTEPENAGSDPTTLTTRAELEGDEWVINGHKWFTSGYNGAALAIVMVVTDPDAQPHKRASQIIVPLDTPGFVGVRPVPVMGHDEGPGLIGRFKETSAYDRLSKEAGSLGDRLVEELSTTAHTVLLPLLLNKIKGLIGVDLSDKSERRPSTGASMGTAETRSTPSQASAQGSS